MAHVKFHYKTLEDIKAECQGLGIEIPFAQNTDALKRSIKIGNRVVPNRLGIAPMEGADSTEDGRPGPYTRRRYVREAQGGAGIIWFEAITFVEEGRSSKTQLLLTKDTVDDFKRLNDEVREAGLKSNGFAPYLVMQANHSGRYSNPGNKPCPIIMQHNAWLETFRAASDENIASDDYLKSLEDKTGEAAILAKKAGFDAFDVKSCHGYLYAEAACAYDREGLYGGSYENRTRLLKNSIKAAKVYESDDFKITARIGIYDGYPAASRGFGQALDGSIDLTEPKRLIKEIYNDFGIDFIDVTMGNPYATTHVVRPYDMGKYVPDDHPLINVSCMANGIREIKECCPNMVIYGSAPTYLRQYSDLYCAALVEQNWCDGMLFGRMSFADPEFPNEIVNNGRIDENKVCFTCGKCGDLIRSHKPTGCVIRDGSTFMPFYKEFLEEKKNLAPNFRG